MVFKLNEKIIEINKVYLSFIDNNSSQIKAIKKNFKQLARIFNSFYRNEKTFGEEINDKTFYLKKILDEKSKLIDEVINSKKIGNNNY